MNKKIEDWLDCQMFLNHNLKLTIWIIVKKKIPTPNCENIN
jgi:hypothetical protein